MKILIAEDDLFEAEALKMDLTTFFEDRKNIEFIGPVSSLSETRQILRNGSDLNLAILDIELMDGENEGIKIANFVSSVARIPIIFVSGLPREKGFDLAKFSRPFSYIKKPYTRQELWDAVELASQYSPPGNYWFNRKSDLEHEVLYLKTSANEITPIPVLDIILIEADDKILNLFIENPFRKVFMNSPGLKNFFLEKLVPFEIFSQVNKKFVINSKKINLIKDNHIHMLPSRIDPILANSKGFPKPIPLPSDPVVKKNLLMKLGIK